MLADNTGISLKMLVRGVVQLETMMADWSLAERKRRVMAQLEGLSSSDEDEFDD